MRISVVVPIYNAEALIKKAYPEISKTLKKVSMDYEILFRDDGSSDESESILKEIAGRDKRVRVFSNSENKGFGYTLKELFNEAKMDTIIYLDADLSFDLNSMEEMVKELNSFDIVVASKYKGAKRIIPFSRLVASEIYHLINKVLFGVNVRDAGAGFLLTKKRVLNEINLQSNGFATHIELLYKAKKKGFKIKEVGIPYNHSQGSFNLFRHGPRTLIETLSLRRRLQ